MPRIRIPVIAGIIAVLLLSFPAFADEPVKWSAPIHAYPKPWNPTQAPPTWNNPYGYNYPYARFGYGPYWGGGYYQGGYPQGYPQAFQDGYQYYPQSVPQRGYAGSAAPNYDFYYAR